MAKSIYMQITHCEKCSVELGAGREEGYNGGGRAGAHNYQIQWCEICMFMRNNIAFLL